MELKIEKLIEHGLDVLSVLDRIGGNETMYLNICNKFIEDQTYFLFMDAIERKDYIVAELRIHTLKGIAANLGFLKLEALSRKILLNIRAKQYPLLEQDIIELTKEYHKIIHIINEL